MDTWLTRTKDRILKFCVTSEVSVSVTKQRVTGTVITETKLHPL